MDITNGNIDLLGGMAVASPFDILDPALFVSKSGGSCVLNLESKYLYDKDVALPANATILGKTTPSDTRPKDRSATQILTSLSNNIQFKTTEGFPTIHCFNPGSFLTMNNTTSLKNATSLCVAINFRLTSITFPSGYVRLLFYQIGGLHRLGLFAFPGLYRFAVNRDDVNQNFFAVPDLIPNTSRYQNFVFNLKLTTGVWKIFFNGGLVASGTVPSVSALPNTNEPFCYLFGNAGSADETAQCHLRSVFVFKNGDYADADCSRLSNYMKL